MKYVILVGDGMGDLPLPELSGKTILEAAKTPAMDNLCRNGELLLVQTVPDGMHPGSDVANLSLLGYEPQKLYTGRAPLEAASMGVELGPGEIACRCNLVTLEHLGGGRVIMRDFSAGHISSPEAEILINDLGDAFNSDILKFYPGISYRHLMTYKGDLAKLFTVPPHDYPDIEVTEFWQRYQEVPAFKKLLDRALPMLAAHPINQKRIEAGQLPANAIWLWGEGKAPAIKTIKEQYNINGSLISAVNLLKGIGIYGGLEIIEVPGATGYLDTNYAGKAEAALEALARRDLVLVHVEAPDEAGHQGLIKEKQQAIEDFDQKIVAPIVNGLKDMGKDFRVALTMDHFTPVSTKTHAAFPVPIALYDSRGLKPGCGLTYTEDNAKTQGMPLGSGKIFFEKLLGMNHNQLG